MTEWLHFHFSLSRTGEGNGNPLQYSWPENLRDGGAWWAATDGVTQSWTRLTWFSSSSSRDDGAERKAGNFVFSIILHDIMPTILLCFGNYSFEQSINHLVSESTWYILTHKCVLSIHTHTHTTFTSSLLFAPSPKMCKEKQNHPGCVYTQQSQCMNGNHGMGSSLTMSPALGVLINKHC